MGAKSSTAYNDVTNTLRNNVFSSSQSVCQASCSDLQEDDIVYINNSDIKGGIDITQKCPSQALCTMRNQLEAAATQTTQDNQNAQAQAEGSSLLTWPGLGFSGSYNTLTNHLQNSFTQVISSVCSAKTTELQEDVTIYVNNSNVVGGIRLGQEMGASASCSIDNSAKVSITQSAIAKQSATAETGSTSVIIIAIIVIAIVLIAMAYLSNSSREAAARERLEVAKLKIEASKAGLSVKELGLEAPAQQPSTLSKLAQTAGPSLLAAAGIPTSGKKTTTKKS